MSPLNKGAPAERTRLKTIFILAAGVLGDQAAEANAVYYQGIVQPYEMTFKCSGVPAQWSEALFNSRSSRSFSQDTGIRPQRWAVSGRPV